MCQALVTTKSQDRLIHPSADHAGSERVVPVSSGNPDDKLGGALRDGPQELTESSVTANFA
jgi:hypothetical protein